MMKLLPFFQSGPIGIRNGSEGCIGANRQLENPSTSVAEQGPACPEPSGDEIWSRDQEKMSERPEAACRPSRASSITSNGSCTSSGDSPEKGKKGIKGIFTNALKKMKKIKPPSGKCSSILLAPPHRPWFPLEGLHKVKNCPLEKQGHRQTEVTWPRSLRKHGLRETRPQVLVLWYQGHTPWETASLQVFCPKWNLFLPLMGAQRSVGRWETKAYLSALFLHETTTLWNLLFPQGQRWAARAGISRGWYINIQLLQSWALSLQGA